MDATVFRAVVQVEPSSSDDNASAHPVAPKKAIHRTHPILPIQDRRSIELQDLPTTPGEDLEMSRPDSPTELVETTMSVWDPYMNRFRFLSLCSSILTVGLNDSAAGALIPYMETYYNIGYGVVSLIFIGQTAGFIASAILLDTMRARLGRAKLLGLAQVCVALGYIPLVATGPFVLVIFSFSLVGFGIAISAAIGNTFCAVLQNGTFVLGLLHGVYGIGGISGPLIATSLVNVAKVVWSRYYFVALAAALVSLALTMWSFWNFEREQSPAARAREARPEGSFLRGMVSALKLRVVLLGAMFLFAYQGVEVSISGWVISFLINVRGGDPSSVGYVSSGFWAGITVGRFLLSSLAGRVGEKKFVYGLVVGAIAFQSLVWAVPNIVGNAVAVSIVGLLLGPIAPCSAIVFIRAMSHRDALSGMGTISASGSLGGAITPFLTGLLAQASGTYVLHPIVICMLVFMLACWYAVPTEEKKTE